MRPTDNTDSADFAYENLARCKFGQYIHGQLRPHLDYSCSEVSFEYSFCNAVNLLNRCKAQTCSAQKAMSGRPYRTLISFSSVFTGLQPRYTCNVCCRHASLRACYKAFECRYYEEKGFGVIVTARLLNVLALAFTVVFSGFLLLSVKWAALQSECVVAGTCDIAEVRLALLAQVTPNHLLCIIRWLYTLASAAIGLRLQC